MTKPKCKKCLDILTPCETTITCPCGNIWVSELKPEGYNCGWADATEKFEDNVELVYEEVVDEPSNADGISSGDTDKA